MSPIATYSNITCDNAVLDHESTETIKNKKIPNGNIDKGDRMKVIILEPITAPQSFKEASVFISTEG